MKINKSSGIEFSRLINRDQYSNFSDIIKCKICFNILINPYDCEKCGNSFCYECIQELLVNHKPCPMSCVHFTIKPSSYGITSYLNTLKFDCLNKSEGCSEAIPYINVTEHDKNCKYCYANCPNIQCKKQIKRQLLEYHVRQECEFSYFKCENCECDFHRKEYFEHIENCKNIQRLLDYKLVYKMKKDLNHSIPETTVSSDNVKMESGDLLSQLPELKDISLVGFLKIILYQISKNNAEFDKKYLVLREDIKDLKEEMIRVSNNNFVFIENFISELELLNDKVSRLDNVKKSIEDTVTSAIRDSIPSTPFTPSVTQCSDGDKEKGNSRNSSALISTAVNPEDTSKKAIEQKEKDLDKVETSTLKSGKIDTERQKRFNKGNRSPKHRSPGHGTTPGIISTKQHRAGGHQQDASEGSLSTAKSFSTLLGNPRVASLVNLKMMIKNQEMIMEYLVKIINKLESQETLITSEGKDNVKYLKSFMRSEFLEDMKIHLQKVIDVA